MLYVGIVTVLVFVLLLGTLKESKELGTILPNQKLSNEASNYKYFSCLLAVVILFFLWFLTAFRSTSIGNDTISYVGYFNYISQYGINKNFEIELGFQYFCLLISKISTNSRFFLVCCATICYFGLAIYILKYSKNILFSIVLTFCACFSAFTNILRQSIAMIIVLYAYQLLKNKKPIWFIFLVALASSFHTTAWVSLLLLFHKYYPYKFIYVIFIIVVVSILSMTGAISNLLESLLLKYEDYFNSTYEGTGWLGVLYELLRHGAFYVFVYCAYKRQIKHRSLETANFFLLLVLTCLGFTVNLFVRATEYFLLIACIELPNAFYKGELKSKNIWIICIGVIMLMYFLVVLVTRPEWNYLYPYRFSWNS